jgi:outer membrane protein assembly factor BamB
LKLVALVAVTTILLLGATGASAGRIPGASAVRACAGAGAYWPTMTLALSGRTAWVACKEQARLVRMNLPGGRKTATVQLDGQVLAVAAGLGAVWALDSGSTLYRLNMRTARITKRIQTGASAAYNIWIGGGAVWVADDQGARVLRISPSTNRVVARLSVGDGPSDMVFAGSRAWVIAHRVNTVFRIDLATNAVTRLTTVGGGNAAAERLTMLGGRLWITGRGVRLLEADPETGQVRREVDIAARESTSSRRPARCGCRFAPRRWTAGAFRR